MNTAAAKASDGTEDTRFCYGEVTVSARFHGRRDTVTATQNHDRVKQKRNGATTDARRLHAVVNWIRLFNQIPLNANSGGEVNVCQNDGFKILDSMELLWHHGLMNDDLNIPRSPTAAAVWLVNQTRDASIEYDSVPVRNELFFLASYQIVKPMFRTDGEQALFLLTIREELDNSEFDRWITKDAPQETES